MEHFQLLLFLRNLLLFASLRQYLFRLKRLIQDSFLSSVLQIALGQLLTLKLIFLFLQDLQVASEEYSLLEQVSGLVLESLAVQPPLRIFLGGISLSKHLLLPCNVRIRGYYKDCCDGQVLGFVEGVTD